MVGTRIGDVAALGGPQNAHPVQIVDRFEFHSAARAFSGFSGEVRPLLGGVGFVRVTFHRAGVFRIGWNGAGALRRCRCISGDGILLRPRKFGDRFEFHSTTRTFAGFGGEVRPLFGWIRFIRVMFHRAGVGCICR